MKGGLASAAISRLVSIRTLVNTVTILLESLDALGSPED